MLKNDDTNLLLVAPCVFGRKFVAARNIAPKEAVFSATPFSRVPDSFSQTKVCSACVREPAKPVAPPENRPTLAKSCDFCPLVYYCSNECFERDTAIHQIECLFWRSNVDLRADFLTWDTYTQDYTTLLIRLIIRASLNQIDFHKVWNMCDNFQIWTDAQLSKFLPPAIILQKFITTSIPDFAFPEFNTEEVGVRIMKVFTMNNYCSNINASLLSACLLLVCKEECNSFGIYTYNYTGSSNPRQGYGLALYPTAVFFNHSCKPNVEHFTNEEGKMVFIAPNGLSKGQEATISYISDGLSVKERKRLLNDWFLFDCGCEKCTEELQANSNNKK